MTPEAKPPTDPVESPRPISRVLIRTPADRIHLRETGEGGLEWAAARPGVFVGRTGEVSLDARDLQAMADSYDPGIDRAPINFDHTQSGPAHGWISSAAFSNDLLWVRPEGLSEEATEKIKAGQLRRVSLELTRSHQITGGWYIEGLALLGSAKPAIKGLPEISLGRSSELVIQLQRKPTVPVLQEGGGHSVSAALAELRRAALAEEVRTGIVDPRTYDDRQRDLAHGITDERFRALASRSPHLQEPDEGGLRWYDDPRSVAVDRRSSEQRRFDLARGLSDERYRELVARYDLQ